VAAALQHGRDGEVWVPRVGAARLVDLIDAVRGDADVPVEVTGIRPGEKMHEQLVSEEDALRTVVHEGYAVIQPLVPELASRAAPPLDGVWSSAAIDLDVDALVTLLGQAGVGPL
jgi:UDP-glucose 4-epimerase